MQEDEVEDVPGEADVPADAEGAANAAISRAPSNTESEHDATSTSPQSGPKKSLSGLTKGAIFREVVMAKVREQKEQEQALQVEKEAQEKAAKRLSSQ